MMVCLCHIAIETSKQAINRELNMYQRTKACHNIFHFYFLQDIVALVHQQRAVVEEQTKTNKYQSGVIEELTMTIEKQALANEQQSVMINKQSVLIQQLQEETVVSQKNIDDYFANT